MRHFVLLVRVGCRRLGASWVSEWLRACVSAYQGRPRRRRSKLSIVLALSQAGFRLLWLVCARIGIRFSLLCGLHRVPDNLRLEGHIALVDREGLDLLKLLCISCAFARRLFGRRALLPRLSFMVKYLAEIRLHLLFDGASLT